MGADEGGRVKPYGQGDQTDAEYAALLAFRAKERAVFGPVDEKVREAREALYRYQLEQACESGPPSRVADRWVVRK